MPYIDTKHLFKCETCRLFSGDKCLTWCENMECYSPNMKSIPTVDVAPKSEEGAECPTCHGTGRIGTTNWLTKNMTKKQIAEEKAQAIAEHEQHIKTEAVREIFEEIWASIAIYAYTTKSEDYTNGVYDTIEWVDSKITELEKKYIRE